MTVVPLGFSARCSEVGRNFCRAALGVRARSAIAIGLAGLTSAGCGAATYKAGAPVPNAEGSEVSWLSAAASPGKDLSGNEVDEIAVGGGDIVRLQIDHPVDLAERVKSGAGDAETWRRVVPRRGVVFLRTSLLANALLVPRGSVARAHVGHGRDPGYAWFDLERDVLAWAEGPVPAPFPAIAPAERVDFAGFAALDRVLAESVAAARDKDAARNAVIAIRRVSGLRAVRALRPVNGFPFLYEHPAKPAGAASAKADRDGTVVFPTRPFELEVSGPTMLHLWSRAVRGAADQDVELRIVEGDRTRAMSGSVVGQAGRARSDAAADPDEHTAVPLRRAIVHVPPGRHTYRVEAKGGEARVRAEIIDTVVHVGDALSGVKNEAKQLDRARSSCERSGSPGLCGLVFALAGDDQPGIAWDGAMRSASADLRAVADDLAAGGPRDPSVALEIAASRGDPTALARLGAAGLHDVDDVVRAAWLRGTLRGTRWVVAESSSATPRTGGEDAERARGARRSEGSTWTSLLIDSEAPECAAPPETLWSELGPEETVFASTTWRGAPTLELLAAVRCPAAGTMQPVRLQVDGETVSANPSSPFAKWHVLVRGTQVRVRRSDGGDGRVFAIRAPSAACRGHWATIGAPHPAASSPNLSYGPSVTAPGVEVWLREGTKRGEVSIEPLQSLVADRGGGDSRQAGPERVRIVAAERGGLLALDENGVRWTRVSRVALPEWAARGAKASGGGDVAVRAIVRAPRTALSGADGRADSSARGDASPLDEELLIALSRAILGATDGARGAAHLRRALVLAGGAAERAAYEDARAAKALGAKGPGGEDPIALVRDAMRSKPRRPLVLAEDAKVFGVESDFDPGATRCTPSKSGPRAVLTEIVEELKAGSAASVAQGRPWDPTLAVRVLEAVRADPMDPRGDAVLSRALAGSRWQTPRVLEGDTTRVQRPHVSPREGVIDPDGDLRARIGAGGPFERGTYAIVTEARPAKAALTGTNGEKARVELACFARSPADASAGTCPIAITVGGGAPIHPELAADGRGSVELPVLPQKGPGAHLTISMDPAAGRWSALARVVFEHEVPGSTKSSVAGGVGWIIAPPGLQYRFLVKAGGQVGTTLTSPGVVRIDALAEPEDHPRVTALVNGREEPLPTDGTPKIFAVPQAGSVRIRSTGGAATIVLAERVRKPALPEGTEAEPDPLHSELADPAEPNAASTTAVLEVDSGDRAVRSNGAVSTWRDTAESSLRPLTPFEAALGTVTAHSLVRTGTLRAGDPAIQQTDSYFEQAVGYRRKIEPIGLWTGVGARLRARSGQSSYNGSAFFYEDVSPLRVRIAGWFDYYAQDVEGRTAHSLRPRAFVEYSGRVTPNFFLLPRLGYDGFYSNVSGRPESLVGIDDDVFNDFRARRPSLLFGQLLAWWVPYFNDIFYLRGRASLDAEKTSLSHVVARPGAFFAFGAMELGSYADIGWYRATPGLRSQSYTNVTGSLFAAYNLWLNHGSVDIQPGIGGSARAKDGGWQVYAMVNVLASVRRGVRDFSSLELSFPEQLGGNVPWRGPSVGGGL